MRVEVDEVVSEVRTIDDEALLSPQVLERIVQSVLAAVRDDDAHRERVRSERSLGGDRR